MALPTTATCVYTVTPQGAVTLTQMENAIESAALDLTDIDQALEDQYGITLDSDTTAIVGSTVVRTIVYNLQNAGSFFFTGFDNADIWAASTIYPVGSKVTPTSPNGFIFFASLPDTDGPPPGYFHQIVRQANPTTFPAWQPSFAFSAGQVVIPSMSNPSTAVSQRFVDQPFGSFASIPVDSIKGFAATGSIQVQNDAGIFEAVTYTGLLPPNATSPGAFTGISGGTGNLAPGAIITQYTDGVSPQNGLYYTAQSTTGDRKTGTAQPAWPTNVGDSVVDHNVTWICSGSTATAEIGISAAIEPTWPGIIGDTVLDNSGPNGIVWTCARVFPPDYAAPFYNLHTHAIKLRGCVRVKASTPVIA